MAGFSFVGATGTDNGGSAALTLDVPAGTSDGDLMLAVIAFADVTNPTVPSGWTIVDGASLFQNTAQNNEFTAYYKYASSEPGSYSWDASPFHLGCAIALTYSGGDGATPPVSLLAGGYPTGSTGTSLTQTAAGTTVTGTGVEELVYIYGGNGGGHWVSDTPDAATTLRIQQVSTSSNNQVSLSASDESFTAPGVGTYPSRDFTVDWNNTFGINVGVTPMRIVLYGAPPPSGSDSWAWFG